MAAPAAEGAEGESPRDHVASWKNPNRRDFSLQPSRSVPSADALSIPAFPVSVLHFHSISGDGVAGSGTDCPGTEGVWRVFISTWDSGLG